MIDPMTLPEQSWFVNVLLYLVQRDVAHLLAANHRWNQSIQSNSPWKNVDCSGRTDVKHFLNKISTNQSIYQSVERLSFFLCKTITGSDLLSLYRFPNLKHLDLGGCHQLTDQSINQIAAMVGPLTSLSLYWMPQLRDSAVKAFAQPKLVQNTKFISLSGLKHVTDQAIKPLVECLTNVEIVDLTRCEAMGSSSLQALSNCAHIRRLQLYACSQLLDDGVIHIANLHQLRSLDMTGASKLTDKSIMQIAKGCRLMNHLILQWCLLLTDDSLFAIGGKQSMDESNNQSNNQSSCGMPHLRHLSVHGLKMITEKGLEQVAAFCTKLESIDINGCVGIADRHDAQKYFAPRDVTFYKL